ncbi:hypothetical protein SAMN05878482_10929 [Peribacillus simplex]|uniref:Uncharacterized protein n=1 Tax=Peribacillus simplex TaxID=1478 RepID=A0A9X8RDL1_9BACI|nr:hypothetical protein SAMN05878482_10929 [Peribacillus simplex]
MELKSSLQQMEFAEIGEEVKLNRKKDFCLSEIVGLKPTHGRINKYGGCKVLLQESFVVFSCF